MAAKLPPTREVNPPDTLAVRTHRAPHRSLLPHADRAARWLQLGGSKAGPGLMRIITRRAALAGFGCVCTGRITGIHRTRTMAEFSPDQVVFNKPKVRQAHALKVLYRWHAGTFRSGFGLNGSLYSNMRLPLLSPFAAE